MATERTFFEACLDTAFTRLDASDGTTCARPQAENRGTPLVDHSHETRIENVAASRVYRISITHNSLNGNRA